MRKKKPIYYTTMTDFEKRVLREVCKIPIGQVRSYKWLAKKCGKPTAYRAVANAGVASSQ